MADLLTKKSHSLNLFGFNKMDSIIYMQQKIFSKQKHCFCLYFTYASKHSKLSVCE